MIFKLTPSFPMSAWNNGSKSRQNFGSSSLFCSSFMSSFISSYSMSPHKDTSFGNIQLHGLVPRFVYSVLYYSCANLLWCRDFLGTGKALLLHITSMTGKLCKYIIKNTFANCEMDNALKYIWYKGPSSLPEKTEVSGDASFNSTLLTGLLI